MPPTVPANGLTTRQEVGQHIQQKTAATFSRALAKIGISEFALHGIEFENIHA
jgi:hypothetical protein